MNKAQLIGHTGGEPEFRTTASGKKVATFRVCTNSYTKKNGERKDYPTWHTVEIWNQGIVGWLDKSGLPKGSKVLVEGEIRHDRWTGKDGQERFSSKVVVTAPQHQLQGLNRPVAAESGQAA